MAAGMWTGTLMDGSTAVVNINASGTFSGSDSGCSFQEASLLTVLERTSLRFP
jgi:hypothetical protein